MAKCLVGRYQLHKCHGCEMVKPALRPWHSILWHGGDVEAMEASHSIPHSTQSSHRNLMGLDLFGYS
ncbi:hypothetical protein BU24DRAFT_428315 [Aaosphaeria arxii CBS 175.79]|uniref:Uncharacterized protein n=1 Tax=Aaosphaeria arxii CBS 175.79 TaxID=1450172 RepID=A0A6A5X913_9PLEO|nr:uncharacterized protein BU24DRAFT_428315 [Aaosphaeria arxii CBS 175.79]KAF2009400.1 hypothetical protein BU24DRAFT_428315 [Aaosphaeria arxii CBS 175.79]